jgi:L-threonylcarbamoyladenylate synthase
VSTEILPTDSLPRFQRAVTRAAELLRAGEVVAVPTETVYGLAANAFDPVAVQRIFKIKGRPAHNPIIVHVSSPAMARRCAVQWPAIAEQLAQAFWPGPLTLVLPRAEAVPDTVTAGGPTVGLRWPSHPFMQALIAACDFPLAAPSANLSNRVSPTNAAHVSRHLGGKIRLIIDGGQSQVGIESTVLDVSVTPPRLLRPGMIHQQALEAVIGKLAFSHACPDSVLKSPGQLPKHYAPRARLAVWSWTDPAELAEHIASSGIPPGKIFLLAHTVIPSDRGLGRVAVIPREPEAFARALYAELHECDEAGAELIAVEMLPPGDEWKAVADRLKRAAQV